MLTPEPADKVNGPQGPAGEPRVAARATEAAAPARFRPAVATADLNSQQRSERVDALVTDVAALKSIIGSDTRFGLLWRVSESERALKQITDYDATGSRHSVRHLAGLIARVNELEAERASDKAGLRTFWQRLRWLVTGR